MDTDTKRTDRVFYALFFASGVAALLYQVVWTKRLTALFGATSYAVATTVAIFMLGLALGSRYFGAVADRTPNRLRCYCLLELGVAVTAACSLVLLGALDSLSGRLHFAGAASPGFVLFRVCGVFAVLLAPTFLMGGTLPVLARQFVTSTASSGRKIGRLYALNTLGGVIGCLLAGFFVIPAVGLQATLLSGVCINLLIGWLAYRYGAALRPAPATVEAATSPVAQELEPAPRAQTSAMLTAFFFAGFFGLAAEVVWTRMLLLYLDATSQAFAAMLAVYLFGLAAGSALAARRCDRYSLVRAYGALQVLAGVSIAACMLLFAAESDHAVGGLRWLVLHLPEALKNNAIFKLLMAFALAGVLLLPPTLLMGFAFPFAGGFFARKLDAVGKELGRAYMLNTLGSMCGPLLCGMWWLPWLGIQRSLLICAVGFVAAGLWVLIAGEARRWLLAASATALIALLLALVGLPEQVLANTYSHRFGKLLHYEEDLTGSVAVFETPSPLETSRTLTVGTTSMIADNFRCRRYTRLLGHLPVLLHKAPRRALVICLGSGMTAAAIASHAEIEAIDCVDLSPGVAHAAREYFQAANDGVLDDPRLNLILDDGRTHLLATEQRYDVITLEPPPPNNAGVANLYSLEFYELCRAHLAPGGMLAQWIPFHSVTPEQGGSLIATMQAVLPNVTLWNLYDNEEYCAVGQMEALSYSYEDVAERLDRPGVKANLTPVGIRSMEDLLACFVMGPEKVRAFCGQAPLVYDDRPGIGYDWQAFGAIDQGAPAARRMVQAAGLAWAQQSEPVADTFQFSTAAARADFEQRFAPVRRAWQMHNRAVQIAVFTFSGGCVVRAADQDFMAPLLSDAENPYYQYAQRREIYSIALEQLTSFFQQTGRPELARGYVEQAARLKR